jgi:hypothetical protein
VLHHLGMPEITSFGDSTGVMDLNA